MAPLRLICLCLRRFAPQIHGWRKHQPLRAGEHCHVLWCFSLPLVPPATAASALLLFIQTVESFEVPLKLGSSGTCPGLHDGGLFFFFALFWGLASAYAMMLLVLSMVLLFVYFRLVRHTERYLNDHRQGLQAASPFWHLALFDFRAESAYHFSHHRPAFHHDVVRFADASLWTRRVQKACAT